MSRVDEVLRSLTRRRFFALNFKMIMVILTAAVIAIGAFFGLTVLEEHMAQDFYLSESAQKRLTDNAYDSLTTYIQKNHVKASDTQKLNAWLEEQDYTQLIVYDNKHDIYSAGFVLDSSDASAVSQDSQSTALHNKADAADADPEEGRIRADRFQADLYNRIVSFADGRYYVFIKVTEEISWYNTMNILNVVISAMLFLFVILIYNTLIIRRIGQLSEEVQQISEGDLDLAIHVGHNDEIGNLAASVDSMRDALIERMNNEREAWDANTQLITAMSHDIRTPLTSLIGYLDIIESGKFDSEEERSRYIASSREKAFQLKELSDKLFRYFLVFGREEAERDMELVDGGILFQQLLVEHVAETTGYGYRVNLQYNIPEGVLVRVDISSVQRLFDNLFSNLMKYADRRFYIEIKADLIRDKVKLILSNHIQEETKKVESTKIGVKTCKKICTDMGCSFHAMEEEKIYTTEILVPVVKVSD